MFQIQFSIKFRSHLSPAHLTSERLPARLPVITMTENYKPAVNLFQFEKDFETFSAGETIFEQGDAGSSMYAVQTGEVDLILGDKVLETVGAPGFLGEMALIDDSPRSAKAVAKTDCTLVPISQERFKYLVSQETPIFALQVMQTMVHRLRKATAEA